MSDDTRFRFNLDTEEVELVSGDKVIGTSGADVFANWVSAYNEKHKPVDDHNEKHKPVEEPPAPAPEPEEEPPAPVEGEETVYVTIDTPNGPVRVQGVPVKPEGE